jgi:hypothetical protein
MAVVVTIEHGIVVGRFTGDLVVADFLHADNAVKAIDRVTPGRPRMIDLTGITGVQMAFAPVARFTDERRHWNPRVPVRTAILTTSEDAHAVARWLESLLAHPTIYVEVFLDRQAALDWLMASRPSESGPPLTRDEPPNVEQASKRLAAGVYVLATHDGPVRERLAAAFQLTLSEVSSTLPDEARAMWDAAWTVVTAAGAVDASDPHALARSIDALEPDQAVRVVEQVLAVEAIVADAVRLRT